jgi:hypothetical protein
MHDSPVLTRYPTTGELHGYPPRLINHFLRARAGEVIYFLRTGDAVARHTPHPIKTHGAQRAVYSYLGRPAFTKLRLNYPNLRRHVVHVAGRPTNWGYPLGWLSQLAAARLIDPLNPQHCLPTDFPAHWLVAHEEGLHS